MDPKNRYHFVIHSSAFPADIRVAEQARSAARSHAARVSYPHASRAQQQQTTAPPDANASHTGVLVKRDTLEVGNTDSKKVSGHDGRIPRFRIGMSKSRSKTTIVGQEKTGDAQKPAPRNHVRGDEELQDLVRSRLPRCVSKSALDPFVPLCTDLSVPDLNLLHVYLSQSPHGIYGSSSSTATMSIVNRKTIQNASEIQVTLYWCLLATEVQGFSFQSTATEREVSILTRRTLAYRAMRKDLARTDDALPSDTSILGLAIAISAEQRLGNLKAARFHCQAVKVLLFRRNGLQTLREISYPSGIMVLNCVIGLGLPGLYADQDIHPEVHDLRRKVRAMQYWNESLWPPDPSRGPKGDGTTAESIGEAGLRKRMEAFSERPLFEYVSIPPRPLEEAEYRWFLPMLYTLNSVLFAFRAHQRMTCTYLDLLGDSVRLSENTDFICKCVGERLPSLVLVIMLGHCAQRSEGNYEDSAANEVYAVEEILEFVELVMMASKGSRDLILQAMWSWLTAVEYGDVFRLSGAKLDILENEIVATWDKERRS